MTSRAEEVLAQAAGGQTVVLSELDAAVFPVSHPSKGSMASDAMIGLLRAISWAEQDLSFNPPRHQNAPLFPEHRRGLGLCQPRLPRGR